MLRWLFPMLLLILPGAQLGLQRLETEQVGCTDDVQPVVPEPVSGNPALLPASSGSTLSALASVVGEAPDDFGLNADAGRPWVMLDVSNDQVNQYDSFSVRVTGRSDGGGGIEAIWWWATGTSDPDLHNIHINMCNGTSSCSGRWEVSADDGWSEIWIHARARDRYGRDSDEVTRDIWVR